jgi:glycosyltransferase involved in cell wall biosynthesis
MKAWLITTGEPIHTDPGDNRLLRTGMLAAALACAGHSVTWWTSRFDHRRKTHRAQGDASAAGQGKLSLRLLESPGYPTNVSFRRLYDHSLLAVRFLREAWSGPFPDVVVVSLPPVELAVAAVVLCRLRGIPVALDVRDLWPDVFADVFPKMLKWATPAVLWPYEFAARFACRHADRLLAPSEAFLRWAEAKAGGARAGDAVIPFAYNTGEPTISERDKAVCFWRKHGVEWGPNSFLVCFFGTIGMQFDFETVIRAAEIVQRKGLQIQFVLCGDGDSLAYWRDRAALSSNVVLPGWINRAQIWELMRWSKAGLAPYVSTKNFDGHMPNKPIEYFSAGLPVLSSAEGETAKLLVESAAGLIYKAADAEALARNLELLHNDVSLQETLSRNARRLFNERYAADVVLPRFVRYLQELSERTPAKRRAKQENA